MCQGLLSYVGALSKEFNELILCWKPQSPKPHKVAHKDAYWASSNWHGGETFAKAEREVLKFGFHSLIFPTTWQVMWLWLIARGYLYFWKVEQDERRADLLIIKPIRCVKYLWHGWKWNVKIKVYWIQKLSTSVPEQNWSFNYNK